MRVMIVCYIENFNNLCMYVYPVLYRYLSHPCVSDIHHPVSISVPFVFRPVASPRIAHHIIFHRAYQQNCYWWWSIRIIILLLLMLLISPPLVRFTKTTKNTIIQNNYRSITENKCKGAEAFVLLLVLSNTT